MINLNKYQNLEYLMLKSVIFRENIKRNQVSGKTKIKKEDSSQLNPSKWLT
jgi:hypothetical protein